jgi:adenylate cyclase
MSNLSPDRVLLRRAEVDAERVVSLLRIGVSLGLLGIFFLTVWDSVETVEDYLRRQWLFALTTMISYLLLGLFTLWRARRGMFRGWMIWTGVTLDCAFLLVNAWVGLENTSLPGGVTFLLPPIWLGPTVLAFAVLRFNPYLQAYTVILIVSGLSLMILWQPEEMPVQAAERALFLLSLPPNIIRISMIALAGVVLVVAAYRMRALLHRSITEAQARTNLTRYLPAQLAGRLADGGLEELRQGHRQDMAVLFIDIRGFTRWSEGRDPQEVSALITEFRHRVQRASAQTGGMIDKYIGDAAMLLFEGRDGACRALDCVDALDAELEDWSTERANAGEAPILAGIGLHWGEVFSGVVGNSERLEYSVFGDSVNTAARLEQLTRSANVRVIVSDAVIAAAGTEPARDGWFTLPPVHLRGRSNGLAVFARGQIEPDAQGIAPDQRPVKPATV